MTSLMEKLSALRPAKPPLICETDGFSLRAAVLGRSGSEIQVLHAAQSRQGDLTKALAEVMAALEKQGWQPGGKALLLTPDVVPALLELPADPAKPKTLAQMEELVRWEMEPLMLQQWAVWSVGSILVGMGYLNETQARDVIKEQQLRSRRPQPRDEHLNLNANVLEVKSQFKRFGYLAVELGYITQAQLDDCLARQNTLKSEDDNYLFGWAAQASGKSDEDKDTFTWLASGVSKGVLRQWAEAFEAYGLKLEALYPLVGCAAAHLPPNDKDDAVLLEINGGMAAGLRVSGGRVTALNIRHSTLNGALESCLESWEALQPREGESFWLADNDHGADKLGDSLKAVLDRDIQAAPALVFGAGGGAVNVGAALLGAARHAWRMPGNVFCCEVRTAGPQPAFWRRREVRLAAAGVAALLLLTAVEVSLQMRFYLLESELEPLTQRQALTQQAISKVQAEIEAAKKVETEFAAKQAEHDAIKAQVTLLTSTLPERNSLVRGLLEDLDKMTPNDIVLNSIQESGQGFVVTAWALSDSSAQRFAKSFAEAVRRWNQRVVDVQVTNQKGRLEVDGYALKFRLFAVPPEMIKDGTTASGGGV
jgi:hypothetical protein